MALIGLKDLASLGGLFDGGIDRKFRDALQAVLCDLDDRPTTEKGRKVTISVECVPQANAKGKLEKVDLVVEVKTSVPAHRTWSIKAIPRVKEGRLDMNELSPRNPDQLTLDGMTNEALDQAVEEFNAHPPVDGAKVHRGGAKPKAEGRTKKKAAGKHAATARKKAPRMGRRGPQVVQTG